MLCRRCRREVSDGVQACDYCGLPNPTEAASTSQPNGGDSGQLASRPSALRRVAPALISTLMLVGLAGVWGYYRWKISAPACEASPVLMELSEVLHSGAVFALPPDDATLFPVSDFSTIDEVKAVGGWALSLSRACSARVVVSMAGKTAEALREAAESRGGVEPAPYWHAAESRLEVPVDYVVSVRARRAEVVARGTGVDVLGGAVALVARLHREREVAAALAGTKAMNHATRVAPDPAQDYNADFNFGVPKKGRGGIKH